MDLMDRSYDQLGPIFFSSTDISEKQESYSNKNHKIEIVGNVGISKYRLSEEIGISCGLGVNWNLMSNIALEISGKYNHTERNLFSEYPGSPDVDPDKEEVHDYSLEILGLLYSRSHKFFIGLGPSFHYYDLFRTGTGSVYVGSIFPEGKDSEIRTTLCISFGYKANVIRSFPNLGMDFSWIEDFKAHWSRRSSSLCLAFYWR